MLRDDKVQERTVSEAGQGEGDGSQEGDKERVDRELIELLNELRVTLPGVQVLFAFLLIVPFSQGYDRMSDTQRDVYFASFLPQRSRRHS